MLGTKSVQTFDSEKKWVEGIDFAVVQAELDVPETTEAAPHEIVFCYGLLCHLNNPFRLLRWAASRCADLILCDTYITSDDSSHGGTVKENAASPTQALNSVGARLTQRQIMAALQERFPRVYVPATRPWHEEFPRDWTQPQPPARSPRAIYVAVRRALLASPFILDYLLNRYGRI